jgi:RHS repeat-associated protein
MARKAVPHASLIILICLLLSTPAAADYKINYIHTDHRGAPVAMTDQSQAVIWRASYKPFGEAILQEDPDNDGVNTVMNIRYPGQYYDQETGTYYNYYRDYDPGLGRYIQSDPIGVRKDFSDPQMQVAIRMGIPLESGGGINHLYGYVNQNPLSFVDPFGLYCYIQKSTGTRVCDTAVEQGYSEKYSFNGDNSAYPDSMNNQCVKDCINREIQQCVSAATSPGKQRDVRAAVAQAMTCSTIVVAQCTATAANCNKEDDCEK